jgi:hypothetical protein
MGFGFDGKGLEAQIHQEFEAWCVISGAKGVASRTALGDSGDICERGDRFFPS